MAGAAGVIGAIASVASAASSIYGGFQQQNQFEDAADAQREAAESQREAAYEQELLADENARNIEAETFESARRESLELDKTVGVQRARAAASGLSQNGTESGSLLIQETEEQGQKQIEWLKAAGKSQADIVRREGDISRKRGLSDSAYTRSQAKNTKAKGRSAAVGGVTRAVSQAGNIYNSGSSAGWWGK